MKKLLSFHGKQSIKDKYLKRLKAHYHADEIIKGEYWQNGKGCAVGCTVHSSKHSDYEDQLGIPRILAKLEDRIFEGMPNEDAKEFPLQFLSAVPVGKDLTNVWKKFFIWMLVDPEDGVIKFAKKEESKTAIRNVANLLERSLLEEVSAAEFWEVRKAAYADAYAAAAAAAYAYAYAAAAAAAYAYAAAYAAAAAYADADAYAAAAAAAYADAAAAAYAAAAAAAYADADAYAYAAAAADAYAARKSHYKKMAKKLVLLLEEAQHD